MLALALAALALAPFARANNVLLSTQLMQCGACEPVQNTCPQTSWTFSQASMLETGAVGAVATEAQLFFHGSSLTVYGTLIGGEVTMLLDGAPLAVQSAQCGALAVATSLAAAPQHNLTISLRDVNGGDTGLILAGFAVQQSSNSHGTATAVHNNAAHLAEIIVPVVIGGLILICGGVLGTCAYMRRRATGRTPPTSRARRFIASNRWVPSPPPSPTEAKVPSPPSPTHQESA